MTKTHDRTKTWLTSKEMMHYLALPKSTFELLIKRGMPLLRIGKIRRFKIQEVETWLKNLEK